MTKNDDRTPQEWREILRSWDYPEEAETGRRRERRRARKAHRTAARRRTTQWVREERRRDPIKPTAALVIVALILGLGAGARWLWPGLTGGGDRPAASVSASPTPAVQDDKPGTDETTSSPSSSPSPSSAVDLADADHVAEEAIRRYLTRNPPADGDHTAPVLRAAPYMTPALVENLASSSDPAWDKLVSRGGVATVTTIKAVPSPEKEGLPVDTPLRVWRQVTAKVHVEGYTNYDEQRVLQVELTSPGGTEWRVSRILGL
ncbi:hypothetical protein [Streptomyces halstedii]|uniref:hypothetical protein n=1 Tax=Streptomyces halstedii TaxID=1944 RepID=UPI0004C5C212